VGQETGRALASVCSRLHSGAGLPGPRPGCNRDALGPQVGYGHKGARASVFLSPLCPLDSLASSPADGGFLVSSGKKPPLEDSVQFTFSSSTLSTLGTKGLECLFANARCTCSPTRGPGAPPEKSGGLHTGIHNFLGGGRETN